MAIYFPVSVIVWLIRVSAYLIIIIIIIRLYIAITELKERKQYSISHCI